MTVAAPALDRSSPAMVRGHRDHVRSPLDVLRLIVGMILMAAGVLLANLLDNTLLGLNEDSQTAMAEFPAWARDLPETGLAVAIAAAMVAVLVWSLVTTRFRRFAQLLLGFGLAAGLSILLGELIYSLIDEQVRTAFESDGSIFRVSRGNGRLLPGDPLLAGAAAMLVISSSYVGRLTSRRLAAVLVAYAFLSILTSGLPALGLVSDLGAGVFVGSVALLALGRHDLSPDARDITAGLAAVGIEVSELSPSEEPTDSSVLWRAATTDGRLMDLKAVGRDDLSADFLYRSNRWIRFRKTVDHQPFVSLRSAVEHEALVSLHAASIGIRTPELLGIADAGMDNMVLAYEHVTGTPADQLRSLDEDELISLWLVVGQLHQRRIAHRDLKLRTFAFDADHLAWVTNLGSAKVGASEQELAQDIAELLAASAAIVGTSRAVEAAALTVDRSTLERALPWIQPMALSSETREAIDGAEGLADLRAVLIDRCGLEPEDPIRLERISGKTLFVIATIALSAWFLIPQLADVDNLWRQARNASGQWVALAVAFSVVTYIAATASLLGAIPVRLRFGPAFIAQIASSFANRITPAKVGGLATNIRYFQRQGVPTPVGVTAVGLNAIAGVVIHVLLTLWFLLLASDDSGSTGLHLPSSGALGAVLVGLLCAIVLSVAIPITRGPIIEHVWPQIQAGWEALRSIAHSPGRLVLLFGGSAAISLAYLGAMTASLKAFDSTVSFPLIGLLFLTGSAVANAAPTPGGVGAAEAALIAAFSTVEQADVVIPAVFLYRLVTFWLPILPGWAALAYLRHTDNI